MSIAPFLRNQAFGPEALEAMTLAYQNACRALGLTDREDRRQELVAKQVIKFAQTGVRTPSALYMLTMIEFKANPQ